jgi:quercetin dioxygenase-like cupin family protein
MKSGAGSPRVTIVSASDDHPSLPIVDGEGSARAVVWPGIGAELRSMHHIVLGAGASTVPQRHPHEAVYHVTTGTAQVRDLESDETTDLRVGSMVHVEPGTGYVFLAGLDGVEIIGGPCPADPDLYIGITQHPAEQGA